MQKLLNKLFYSYYSVFLVGTAAVFILYECFELFAHRYVSFPTFLSTINIVIGLFIAVSNIALVKHEKFRPTRLLGIAFVLVNVLYAGVIQIVKNYTPDYVFYFFNALLYGYFIMSFLAVKRKHLYDTDFIIIPGCSISKSGGLLPLLKGRTNKAIHYAWEHEIATGKSVLYVPSGGKGRNEIMSEGSAMEFYLLSHGAEEYEVFPEKDSKNTEENILFSKSVIDGIMKNAKIDFCTTNFHVFRTGLLAQKAGINARGISSSTKWYFWPNALLREFIAFLKMYKKRNIVILLVLLILGYVFGGII